MRRSLAVVTLLLVFAGGLTLAPAARAQQRKADQIVKDIEKVEMPKFDPAKINEPAARLEFLQARQKAMGRRSDLIGELITADPANVALTPLLTERVQVLMTTGGDAGRDKIKAELKTVVDKAGDPKLKAEAAYWATLIQLRTEEGDTAAKLKAVEAFAKLAPKDDRAAILLYAVGSGVSDTKQQVEIYKRIVKEFPESRVASMVEGRIKQAESIGKPFELEFTEAIKGTTVSMKSLKGKVVVIDFWATWCGPCVAEMPNMKKLYAEYKPKGVEFIGVSLDQPKEDGGLKALQEFVAKNQITWPQYYQGKGWESDFSKGWGINSIPAVFVVDQEGKLYSIDARGKLDEIIPELLKRAKGASGAGAGAGGH